MLEDLLEHFRQRDRHALARLLTLVARGENLAEISAAVREAHSQIQKTRVIAFTGSAGVGKSSLIGKLIDVALNASPHPQPLSPETRGENGAHRIAVLACDPQSPLSGGALLGDRFRMGSHDDDRLFIRSLAALSGHSSLADNLPLMIGLLGAYGFDIVFLETVGAGQGDTAVRALADVVVLLIQPESGDDLQWEKAGVLEVADIVVVHKADLPGGDQTVAQVRSAIDLSASAKIQVLAASSKTGAGLHDLWRAIDSCPSRREWHDAAQEVLRLAQEELAERVQRASSRPEMQKIITNWQEGRLSEKDAARRLLDLLMSADKVV